MQTLEQQNMMANISEMKPQKRGKNVKINIRVQARESLNPERANCKIVVKCQPQKAI